MGDLKLVIGDPLDFHWRPQAFHWSLHIFIGDPKLFIGAYIFLLETPSFRQSLNIFIGDRKCSHRNPNESLGASEWKAFGLYNEKLGVSNEILSVFIENLGVSDEKLWTSNDKVWVSNKNQVVSKEKLKVSNIESGHLRPEKNWSCQKTEWVSNDKISCQCKSGVFYKMLGDSNKNLEGFRWQFLMRFWWGSPKKGVSDGTPRMMISLKYVKLWILLDQMI